MLQQTSTAKKAKKFGWLDGLFSDTSDGRESARCLRFLSDDYAAFLRLGANLGSHSRWIPYPFLANRLKKIAEELRAQAETVRDGIAGMNSQAPQVAIESRDLLEFRQNVRRLVEDMEEHAALTEALMHQRNRIRNRVIITLLDALILEMQKQKDELLEIVMKLS